MYKAGRRWYRMAVLKGGKKIKDIGGVMFRKVYV
jgi:hypothetical protein